MYIESDFVKIAKRENNTKRSFLIVNPLQGKHIPASPSQVLSVFSDISELIYKEYKNEKVLVIGFAETATAIGSQIAIDLKCDYIQTTREILNNVQYLFFSEEHSHATEQKLVRDGLDSRISSYRRIIFVDDEISTGKTVLNIIDAIEKAYNSKFNYSVVSILNGMNEDNLDLYKSKKINLHYLIKTNPDEYSTIANNINVESKFGSYVRPDTSSKITIKSFIATGLINPRRIIDAQDYLVGCENLWNQIDKLKLITDVSNVLIVGTEEFMYPAMYVGKQIESMGKKVRFHATTRSPILVSDTKSYPVHKRYELRSLYDSGRVSFIYDVNYYEHVLIITDANPVHTVGLNTLINAFANKASLFSLIRWTE